MLFIISQLDVYTTADVSPAVLSNLGQKNGKQLWNKWLDVAREMRDLVPEYNDYARKGIPSGVGLIVELSFRMGFANFFASGITQRS